MRCGAGRSCRRGAVGRGAARDRRGRGEEARVPPHDDIDLDAAEARIVERVPHQREADIARRRRETRRVVVLQEIVVDRLRHVEAAELVAGGGRLLAHDAAGVGQVVAADIEEIADVVRAAAVEDLLAIGLVRLVAGRAERGGGRARDRLELRLVNLRSDRAGPSAPGFTSPRTPCRMPKMRPTLPDAASPARRPSTTPASD